MTDSTNSIGSTNFTIDITTRYESTTTTATRGIPVVPINAQALLDSILMNYPEYRLATFINSYGYITEVVVGSVANILALAVMLKLKHLPICNYMAALALGDLSILLGPCLLRWLLTVNIDPRPSNAASCKIVNFLTYWTFSFSAWILVAMTVDRYIAISFPLKALCWSTPRRARAVVVFLMVVMALINFHFFVTMVIETRPGMQDNMCVGYDKFRHFLEFVWPWIDATVHSFLPFGLLIVFNVLIIRSHGKSIIVNSTLKGLQPGEMPHSMTSAYRKITATLLLVAFSFIIMTAPKLILLIIRPTVFNFKPAPNRTDFKILAQYTLAASLVNILLYANHCINFFLYILTGQKFRQQLVNMLKCRGRSRLGRVHVAQAECSGTETNTTSLRYNASFTRDDSSAIPNLTKSDRPPGLIQAEPF